MERSSIGHTSISSRPDERLFHRQSPVEGETSFGTQVLQASEVVELTSPGTSQSPAFAQELANLRGVLRDQGGPSASRENAKSDGSGHTQIPETELPPAAFIMQLLKSLRDEQGTQCALDPLGSYLTDMAD